MPTTSKTAAARAARADAEPVDDRSTAEKAKDAVKAFEDDEQGASSPLLVDSDDDDDDTDDTVVDQHGDRVSVSTLVSQPVTRPQVTYTDNQGIERVAGGFDDGWEPAEVDPDPRLVAHNEKRQENLKAASEKQVERQKARESKTSKTSES